ncbi:MAG: tetratricopeptide repeat protein [Sphingomonadaceae bacterium]
MRCLAATVAGLLLASAPASAGGSAIASMRAPTEVLMADALAHYRAGRHAEARRLFRLLAERQQPAAETLLGVMAANGMGGPADEAVAAGWFLRAARRGYVPAQLALANSFARGRGVRADPARARALAEAAAVQGQPGAATVLGRLR